MKICWKFTSTCGIHLGVMTTKIYFLSLRTQINKFESDTYNLGIDALKVCCIWNSVNMAITSLDMTCIQNPYQTPTTVGNGFNDMTSNSKKKYIGIVRDIVIERSHWKTPTGS